jgi:hypothetical protein
MSALARIAGPVVGLSLLEYGPEIPSWCGAGIVLVSCLLILTLRKAPAHHAG